MVASNKLNFGRIMAEGDVHKLRKVLLFDPPTTDYHCDSATSYVFKFQCYLQYLKEPQR